MSVFFQTIEKERTAVYIYKLIKLESSETGKAFFDAIYDQLEEN